MAIDPLTGILSVGEKLIDKLIPDPMGILSLFSPESATTIAGGMKAWLAAIPDGMWATFGIGYSGYAIARSMDKKNLSGTGQ